MILLLLILISLSILVNGFNLFKLFKKLNFFISIIQQNSLASYDLEIQLGATAPDFNLKDQFGKVISSKENNKINFIFISPTCPTCKTLIKQLHKLKDDVLKEIVFVSQGEIDEEYINELTLKKISYVNSMKVVDDFNIRGVPKLVRIGEKNVIHTVETLTSINDLTKNFKAA